MEDLHQSPEDSPRRRGVQLPSSLRAALQEAIGVTGPGSEGYIRRETAGLDQEHRQLTEGATPPEEPPNNHQGPIQPK